MTKDFTIWGIIDSEETVKQVRVLRENSDFPLANKDVLFMQRNLSPSYIFDLPRVASFRGFNLLNKPIKHKLNVL